MGSFRKNAPCRRCVPASGKHPNLPLAPRRQLASFGKIAEPTVRRFVYLLPGRFPFARPPLILLDLEFLLNTQTQGLILKVRVLLLSSLIGLSLLGESAPTPAEEIVENYCAATKHQEQTVRAASMEVEISGSLPKLQKQGKLHALRHITTLGRITYDALHFQGDNTIKKEVINRYLQQETETIGDPTVAVTPANYKFKYKGHQMLDGRDSFVFQVSPKTKRARLYKGELWIDAATYLRVRESGKLVKTPLGVRDVTFVRRYDIQNGISVPRQLQSVTDVWFYGKAELTVDYANFSVEPLHAGDAENQ